MIYLSRPYFNDNEVKAVKETLSSGWVAGSGPKGAELARHIRLLAHTKYAVPVNSCTAGLHLSLLAIGIKPGDEVLVSDYTFPATAHAVMHCRAIPRFVDVNLKTYDIEADLIEEKINKKTKAIIVVHALGQIADMDSILKIAKSHNLKIIEDAACALGARYKERPAGSFGDLASFSFNARKNITCGEGGMVVTNNKTYANLINSLSCFGAKHIEGQEKLLKPSSFCALGYNYKLSDINASVALIQLKKYPKIAERKRKLANLYNRLLKNNESISIPYESPHTYHVYQTYAITLNRRINRDKLIRSLAREGIQTQIGTYACHIQPLYKSSDKCPNSLFLYKNSLALPLYYELKEEQVYFVARKLLAKVGCHG